MVGIVLIHSYAVRSEYFKIPNPITRVSGKSFIPNRALNTVLIKTNAVTGVKYLGAHKSMQKPLSEINFTGTYCPLCVQFASEALNELLNAILNVGVVGECSKLCVYVGDKLNNKVIAVVCNILCDFVGIEEFVKIIDQSDLDPIYYCELLRVCAINDNGDASITNFFVSPAQGPQETNFHIELSFTSKNGTGTGEFYIGNIK